MTVQEIREEYFISGSPVIVANRVRPAIGKRYSDVAEAPNCSLLLPIAFTVLRMATFEEYLATVKPEHRSAMAMCDPALKYFYEVSVD